MHRFSIDGSDGGFRYLRSGGNLCIVMLGHTHKNEAACYENVIIVLEVNSLFPQLRYAFYTWFISYLAFADLS